MLFSTMLKHIPGVERSVWIGLAGAVLAVLIGAGVLWYTTRQKPEGLAVQTAPVAPEEGAPKLSCEIDQASEWPGAPNAAVVIIATVRNGGAPSVVEDYRLRIAVADGSEVSGATMTIPERLVFLTPNGSSRTIQGSRALYNKTVQPVPRDGLRRGYLLFSFPSDKLTARSVRDYRLSARDVKGREVRCSRRLDQSGPDISVDYPGTE